MNIFKTTELVNKIVSEVLDFECGIDDELILAVVQVGDNPASNSYIKSKRLMAEKCNVKFNHVRLNENISEEDFKNELSRVKESCTGMLVQLPLPNHLTEDMVNEIISPEKDVDGFHPLNVGKMWTGERCIAPCTAAGIVEIAKWRLGNLEGKNVLIINRSNIVGKPSAKLFLDQNCSVEITHSKSRAMADKIMDADIMVIGIGIDGAINDYMLKKMNDKSTKKLIVDVGINMRNGKLVGDVQRDCYDMINNDLNIEVSSVPGGCGPMTCAMLMKNIVECYKLQNSL